jgi:DNA-binding PadR family transcriptional regulator
MSVSEVSRSLKTLKDKKIVVCLNEDKRIGRVYSLTEKGKEILNCIESMK